MSHEFTLRITFGNDAMRTSRDVANALRKLAGKIEHTPFSQVDGGKIMDENGNSVGRWDADWDDEEIDEIDE